MKPVSIIDRGRGPEVAGTRITVFDVLHYLDAGWHPSSIAIALGLSTNEVQAVLRYVAEHEAEVRAMNQRILERIARGNTPEVEAKRTQSKAKLEALRRRLEERKQESNGASDPG
jgi:uncharacterized protein (DUF433 family)